MFYESGAFFQSILLNESENSVNIKRPKWEIPRSQVMEIKYFSNKVPRECPWALLHEERWGVGGVIPPLWPPASFIHCL
jgi:hypothetical protein